MRGKFARLLAAFAAISLSLGMAVSKGEAEQTIKLAHAVGTQDPYQYGSEKFKEFVEKGTSGRLTVQIFPAGQLGNEREIIEGVKVTEVDTVAFRARAAPVHKEYEAKIGKELLDAVLKTK